MTPTHEPRRIVLHCEHGCCELPFAFFQSGVLMIVSRHGGDKHTNLITPARFEELVQQWREMMQEARQT